MKHKINFLLILALMVLIASCSPQPVVTEEQPSEPVQQAEPTAKEPVKLVFHALTWIKEEQEVQKQVVDQWNAENPDIQVELVLKNWGTASEELLTAFDTGDVPDIFHYSQPIIADWKNLGVLADLSPMLTDEDIADVNADVWAGLTADDGSIVGVPHQWEVDVLYYNVDIFEKYGIEPPTMDDPWSFDEMIDIARTLHHVEGPDFVGLGFPGLEDFGRMFPEVWATKIGDPLVYKNDDGEYYLKLSDESIQFIEEVKGLLEEGLIGQEALAAGTEQSLISQFLNGNSPMVIGNGCWVRSRLINEAEGTKGVNWDVAAPLKINTTSIYGYIQTLSVPEASKHKEEAFKFLKWYWSTENVLKIAEAAFIMPGRNSAVNDESLNTSEWRWDLVQEAISHNVLPEYVRLAGWGQFTEGVGSTLFGDYWSGALSIDEFVTKYEAEGTRLLQENN